jgi:hypothetical protein
MTKSYYITVVRDDGDYRFLAGPYHTHQAAMDDLDRARSIATAIDRSAVWYAYGTASVTGYTEPGILNRRGLL